MKKLILASASPRRSRILKDAGVAFDTLVTDADEHVPEGTPITEAVELISARKCRAAAERLREAGVTDGCYVLAADTVVECFGEMLGKPRDREDARRMLTMLAGCGSAVHTGITICELSSGREESSVETTYLAFEGLDADEIEAYIDTDEPYDKAGGYGIQGRAGIFIPGITGDYFNVMGLPLHAVHMLLRDSFGVSLTEFKDQDHTRRS